MKTTNALNTAAPHHARTVSKPTPFGRPVGSFGAIADGVFMGPNENKMSHHWRERAWQRDLRLESSENLGVHRPAVGSIAWLDVWGGFTAVDKIDAVSAPHKKSVDDHGQTENNEEGESEETDAKRIVLCRGEEHEGRLQKAENSERRNSEPRET